VSGRDDLTMRGLVAAGGHATRLRPLTYSLPKQLISVANKPIIFYVLEDLASAGITDVVIVVAPHSADAIRETVGDGSRFGQNITYIVQAAARGLADVVLVAEEELAGDSFVMYLGDNVLEGGVAKLVDEFEREKPNASIMLTKVEHPDAFGVAVLDGDRVVRLVEKPKEFVSDLALIGVYLFDETVWQSAKSIEPSFRNELEITDTIQDMIDRGLVVRPHVHTGWWLDTGKKDDMLEANRTILETIVRKVEGDLADSTIEGRVVVEPGAKVVRSHVRGPAVIGAGANIVDSYVGPYSAVGDGCLIEDAEVEHSILLSEAKVIGVRRMTDSILGRGAEVRRDDASPRAYRLMIGDLSSVSVL
jgi:glucose-1-phosphate thymidylyltransferase